MGKDEGKVIKLKVDDYVGASDVMIGTANGPSGTGIRRSDSEGHSAGLDQRGNELTATIAGPTVENEKGTQETC